MLIFTFLSYVLLSVGRKFRLRPQTLIRVVGAEKYKIQWRNSSVWKFPLCYSFPCNKWMSSDTLPNNWYGKIWLSAQTETGITLSCDKWNMYKYIYTGTQVMDTHIVHTGCKYIYNKAAWSVYHRDQMNHRKEKSDVDAGRILRTFRRNLLSPEYQLSLIAWPTILPWR